MPDLLIGNSVACCCCFFLNVVQLQRQGGYYTVQGSNSCFPPPFFCYQGHYLSSLQEGTKAYVTDALNFEILWPLCGDVEWKIITFPEFNSGTLLFIAFDIHTNVLPLYVGSPILFFCCLFFYFFLCIFLFCQVKFYVFNLSYVSVGF